MAEPEFIGSKALEYFLCYAASYNKFPSKERKNWPTDTIFMSSCQSQLSTK